jgi:hypothetical protein
MKKVLYIALSLLTLGADLVAQPVVDKSEVFSEPLSEGYTKILMLKNGNTFYLHYGGKKGIEVMVWDKNKQKVASTKIEGENWEPSHIRSVRVCGTYEINGEPVMFLAYRDASLDPPMLIRVRIHPETGELIKEDVVGKLPKIKFMDALFSSEYELMQEIYVEKDPESDYYAVIFFNRYGKKPSDRIKVQHFDGDHKLLNFGYYSVPNPNFKKLTYIGGLVDGDKRVFISTYGAETSKGKNANVFIGCLRKDDSAIVNKPLQFTEDFANTHSDMAYDRTNNTIILLTNTFAKSRASKNAMVSFLSYINADDLTLKGVNNVGNQKTNEYAHNTLGIDMDYSGLPQKLVLNNDNTVTVLQEEMTYATIKRRSGATMAEYTYLGNIGITEIGSDGKEKSGFTMMKSQLYVGHTDAMYMADIRKGLWTNHYFARKNVNDNQFMSYEYIHTPKCNYVLFCDNPKNDKKKETQKKRKLAAEVDHVNTICYTLKDGVATRSYLFGEPAGKNKTVACYIGASHYNQRNSTYTTVVSEQRGRKYDSRIAWIHFD